MTVGKFTWGTIKLVINFVVILVFGMTAYYVYSAITTMPLDVQVLILDPEGTNFGADPVKYLEDSKAGKVLKGDYFVNESGEVGDVVLRNAVQEGLGYYAYNYSNTYTATSLYANCDMSKINLWLTYKGTILGRYGDEYQQYDAYEYVENGKGGHPKLNEQNQYVAPSFSFDNLADMKVGLSIAFSAHPNIVDTIIAYWYLRIGSQVDSYVQFKGERMNGGGEGSGGFGGINLVGTLVLNKIQYNYYGYTLEKSSTIITDVNSPMGRMALEPLLTIADFKFSGHGASYVASGKGDMTKLSSGEYTGPDAAYKASNSGSGNAPTLGELQDKYDFQGVSKSEPSTENKDINNIRACEFGMPASTFSAHIIDLRTIKSVTLTDKNSGGYYGADFICYTYKDGPEWEYVSRDSAVGLANSIGGLKTPENTKGVVDYLNYINLTASIEVFEGGLVRSWKTQEDWNAALADLLAAKVTAASNSIFSYDINDILKDPLNQGVSLPDQLKKLTDLF